MACCHYSCGNLYGFSFVSGYTLLFVSIHFPIWIYNGLFEFPYILSAVIQVFIISISFGFIYKRTGSLWSVIIIHSMYDLLVSVFN
ncbi:CPBP family intramembrane glutamic endopeptidase [Virgibacillus doumboii]|uniref:CPBP family intramembrane glutamic endopeptidase n=1 Tax=Virgibacillus doumboii TaxID=2697503 RepID=UPI0013DE7AB3